jgi:hypothetical protein
VGLSSTLLVVAYIMPDPPDPKGALETSNLSVSPTQTEAADTRTSGAVDSVRYGAFIIRNAVTVPGTPESVFGSFVRVADWWDHTFSASPERFYLEPRPGGGFWEIFDEEGNGVLHATVIYAERGRVLRFDGPLGLSGNALKMVHTLTFDAVGDSTQVSLELHGSGEIRKEWPETVEGVWRHFLVERFKPYVEGRLAGS